jgi:hypothetical protein
VLNADDPETTQSLLVLQDTYLRRVKPIVFWIGAGASRWLGYPSWEQTALAFRQEFFKTYRSGFDNKAAMALYDGRDYPAMFQLYSDLDRGRYLTLLADTFRPKPITPLYERFLGSLSKFSPLYIVTTNVDEALERHLPDCTLVQRSDLTRIPVGLTCFDFLYFPVTALAGVHQLLGSELFWDLVKSDVIRFIYLVHVPSVMFFPGEVIGDLGVVAIEKDPVHGSDTLSAVIRRQLNAAPGKEAEADRLFETLKSKTYVYDQGVVISLASLIRGALLMPSIAKLLGISAAVTPTQVPKWLSFPYLRLGIWFRRRRFVRSSAFQQPSCRSEARNSRPPPFRCSRRPTTRRNLRVISIQDDLILIWGRF